MLLQRMLLILLVLLFDTSAF